MDERNDRNSTGAEKKTITMCETNKINKIKKDYSRANWNWAWARPRGYSLYAICTLLFVFYFGIGRLPSHWPHNDRFNFRIISLLRGIFKRASAVFFLFCAVFAKSSGYDMWAGSAECLRLDVKAEDDLQRWPWIASYGGALGNEMQCIQHHHLIKT